MAKQNERLSRRILKSLQKTNVTINDLLTNIGRQTGTYDTSRSRELDSIMKKANDILDDNVQSIKDKTGDNIFKFYEDLTMNENRNFNNNLNALENAFGLNNESIFDMMSQTNKNRNILYDRLSIISEHLYELEEAVNTTRDAICTSDELSNVISSSLKFSNMSDAEKANDYINKIRDMEKEFNLPHKIKNFIVPKTLALGTYYALTIPHSYTFSQASLNKSRFYAQMNSKEYKKDRKKKNVNPLIESIGMEQFYLADDATLVEGLNSFNSTLTDGNKHDIYKELGDNAINIIIDDNFASPLLLEAMYSSSGAVSTTSGTEFDEFIKKHSKITKNGGSIAFNDGVKDISHSEKFNIPGCYFKLVDPRRLLPIIGIADEVLGYIYLHEPINECGGSINTDTIFGRVNLTNMALDRKQSFVASLSDKIYNAFSKKFLLHHMKFKDTIAQALIYNDYYSKGVTFQYIPLEFVTEFKIAPDLDGYGTSMLKRSLFKAQMYLGMYIFKFMSAIDRSNDVRIYYVKNSSMDLDTINKTQRAMRSISERTPNFTNFSSYSGMMRHVNTANRDIVVPVGPEDVKGIDFDVMSGQDVNMNSDFLQDMRTDYINASGVPSVIMNYVNEADYAKTLVIANAKFLARVVAYQLDFNDSITQLYKKLAKFNGLGIDDNILKNLEFKFESPKMLNYGNINDLIGTTDNLSQFIVRTLLGENNNNDKDAMIKDTLITVLNQTLLPMLPWKQYQDVLKEALLQVEEQVAKDKITNSDNSEE